ncbi:sensor histidine kinase [Gordoniibacillus kamchatkensis]|uniref:sensor histidine kinase n=1 Tax=Gordoniibacillus kamchatkensis TaxID=1590651 RepID=UPI000AA0F48A|nr:HAMP domain-containing sensor histidine kinase [Paenibacillus sp. VKM B-2647]
MYEKVPDWCRNIAEKGVPVVHALHGSHLLREAVIQILSPYDHDRAEICDVMAAIRSRVDSFDRAVVHFYWEYASLKMKEQDRRLDELHEDKINLIGKMAASMAHEIRNPLTSIKGFISLMRGQLSEQSLEHVGKYMDIIENEFENIQMQITGFLSFSKKRVIEEESSDIALGQLIESVLVLVKPRMINENIDLAVDIQCDVLLHVQKVPIQQVLSNLINNGIDALKDKHDGKTMRIYSRQDEKRTYVMIANNGPEIPRELRDSLFEPFVTSKLDGTGLGLAICKQIMKKNNGDIDFVSDKYETTFILSFLNNTP